jgi:hypothetical protein
MRNVDAAMGAGFGTTTMSTAAGVSYDLEYFGLNAGANNFDSGAEFTASSIRNLAVNSTTVAGTTVRVNNPAGLATTISGTLTVAAGQTLTNAHASGITATGSVTHAIRGTLGSIFTITGSAATLSGAVAGTDASAITGNFAFDPAVNNASLSVSGIKVFGGNFTVLPTQAATGVTVNAEMNSTSSTLTGNLVVGTAGAPTVTFTMPGTTTNTHTGGITLTSGSLTYTRGTTNALSTVGGNVTLTAGTFTLGSNLTVTGTTGQAAANMVLITSTIIWLVLIRDQVLEQ